MSERRRPFRRGRGNRPPGNQPHTPDTYGDADPYLEPMDSSIPTPDAAQLPDARDNMTSPAIPSPATTPTPATNGGAPSDAQQSTPNQSPPNGSGESQPQQQQYNQRPQG